jgi:peroxisomal membrane protein 4
MMFGQGSLLSKLTVILQMTRQHSKILALYAFTYKAVMVLLRNMFSNGEELGHYSLIAGGVAGAYCFGTRNPINEQLVLYAFSRAMATVIIPRVIKVIKAQANAVTAAPKLQRGPLSSDPNLNFRIFAALSWAVSMWLYTNRRPRFGKSLVGTMDYLYASCESWTGLTSFLGV